MAEMFKFCPTIILHYFILQAKFIQVSVFAFHNRVFFFVSISCKRKKLKCKRQIFPRINLSLISKFNAKPKIVLVGNSIQVKGSCRFELGFMI